MYVKHAAISDQLVLLYSPNNNEKCLLSISQIFNIKQIIQAECHTSSWWGSISILWLKSCNAQTGLGWSYKHGLCQVSTGRELLTDSTVHIILCFVLCRNKMFTNFCLCLLIFQWFLLVDIIIDFQIKKMISNLVHIFPFFGVHG